MNTQAADHPTSAEMLARLVAFDTTSRNSNLDLIGWAQDWLQAQGVACRISRSTDGGKANLHALIGPQAAGGIGLSGHVDTVPVDGQAWTSDPFTLRAQDGRLYGRGAADMKGFVACMLAAVPALQARRLARPVHLLITFDEETDMSGARRLIESFDQGAPRPDLCIVGEPSLMQPILGHKGRVAVQVTVRGAPGHSSQPARGVNAIHAAAEAIAGIAAQARAWAEAGPHDPRFDPPYSTLHVGTITGGTILNMIPEHARFVMECRNVPHDDFFAVIDALAARVRTQIEPAMHDVDPRTGFSFDVTDWIPGMALDAGHPLAAMVRRLTGANADGYVSYGAEGGLFQQAGIPTIICGPGDIAQAHQPDEWVAQSQLDACDAFLLRLADDLAA